MSGADNPRGQNFNVNRNHLSLQSFATSLKKISFKSDFIQFFHYFIHVYSLGAGADNPSGMKFWCQQNILSLRSFVARLKKNLFEVWFYTFFFMILYMYIAPGQGQTAPRGQSFDFNRNFFSLNSFVSSFKKCLWSLILNNFFSWFNTCI